MNLPDSSFSSDASFSHKSPILFNKNCEVCGKKAHGKHFGAITCRACASFFRRFGVLNNFHHCKRKNKCDFLKNGWFICKSCRFQKCKEVGMTTENFQFDRDSFFPMRTTTAITQKKIPQTIGTFTGRANLIVFCAPDFNSKFEPKHYIDVQFLVERAAEVLKQGAEIPLNASNSLEKLALGLQLIRGSQRNELKVITKLGKIETFALWQGEILKVARWLTYFDEFQQLPQNLKEDMLNGIWRVWSRLEMLAVTAMGRRKKICNEKMVMSYLGKDQIICDLKNVEIDISWCSRYTTDQLSFFRENCCERRAEDLMRSMMDLQPTDVELCYMMCQLCLHHVGKRYQGVFLDIAEQFQETLSNHLHNYYVNNLKMPRYSVRLSNMMKINNHLQKDIYHDRVKSELAKLFDVFYIEFSHPELFLEV